MFALCKVNISMLIQLSVKLGPTAAILIMIWIAPKIYARSKLARHSIALIIITFGSKVTKVAMFGPSARMSFTN